MRDLFPIFRAIKEGHIFVVVVLEFFAPAVFQVTSIQNKQYAILVYFGTDRPKPQ